MSQKIVELLRDRAMSGRMEVRDKQLMLEAADELEKLLINNPKSNNSEVISNKQITQYDQIKAMTLDEMASFFAYLYKKDIIATADRYICQKCKAEHGGHCPISDDEKCLYDLSDKATIKLWLEGEAYDEKS